jgi:hypothetical protein
MGNNTRIEDVTINMTTSTPGVNLTGVYFPNQTPSNAKMRVCIVNVSSTGGDGGYVYGVYTDGTTTNPTTLTSTNAIQRSTINVYSGTTGPTRALYVNGPCQFSVRDSVYFAGSTGTTGTNIIGVEAGNTGCNVFLKTSTVSGITGDIKQPALGITGSNPVLLLSATDLANSNSINGFGTSINSTQITYIATGNIDTNKSYYLRPGNNDAPTTSILSVPLNQKCIIYSTSIYSSTIPNGSTYTISLYNTTNPAVQGTLITSGIITHTTPYIKVQNFASTLNPLLPNYLQVKLTTDNNDTNIFVYITISTY